ncbi:hypothetical protein HZB94_03095 [Candidatus Falkowbacteria bacterium]|nr:hypothetical protein [Candidatus Falkowbacteria bacterium]
MKKVFVVLCGMFCAMAFAAGCGDETIKGKVPVEGSVSIDGPVVMYEGDLCVTNDDCEAQKVCQMDLAASESVGYSIFVCVIGCDAELATETVEVENEDGTSTSETKTVKIEDTDTCQRFEDTTMYCDLVSHTCKEYEVEVPTEPVEPTPEEPGVIEAPLTAVSCCYDGDLTGLYGQLAWSTATGEDPEAWEAARDLKFDAEGCFSAELALEFVTLGFWVDLTLGPHDGKPADEVLWAGETLKPTKCFVGEETSPPGDFEKDFGWPFYTAAEEEEK